MMTSNHFGVLVCTVEKNGESHIHGFGEKREKSDMSEGKDNNGKNNNYQNGNDHKIDYQNGNNSINIRHIDDSIMNNIDEDRNNDRDKKIQI